MYRIGGKRMPDYKVVYPDETPGERPGLSWYCDEGDHGDCPGYVVTVPVIGDPCQCGCGHTMADEPDDDDDYCPNCGASA